MLMQSAPSGHGKVATATVIDLVVEESMEC